jgi:hypothetical protein
MVAGMNPDLDEEMREDFRQEVWFDRPWFIPRSLGDSIRLMGVPDHAALHPLAAGATEHYRYAITDSVRISVPGRTVLAAKVAVEPKRLGPSLIAGELWMDRETADVVRMVVVFVGEYLWDRPDGATARDSAEARRGNRTANRFLGVEADIEYALVDRTYWLPHRQLLAITAEVPWFLNATLPARAISTFSEYRVNRSPEIRFAIPQPQAGVDDPRGTRVRVKVPGDTDDYDWRTSHERWRYGYTRAGNWSGGRWEIDIPPAESLIAYPWEGDLHVALDRDEERRLRESLQSLADISEKLPADWVGRRRAHLAWETFSDIVRFNRVQGLSLGVGYQVRPGPRFTTVLATARFGTGDLRPTGSIVWRRDAPDGRVDLSVYRTPREVGPWTRGLSFGNSLNAMFAGHDDADYYLLLGGGLSYRWYGGVLRGLQAAARVERHTSMATEVDAPFADLFGIGVFRPNPLVAEGTYGRGRLTRSGTLWFAELANGAELLVGESVVASRIWGSVELPFSVAGRTGALTIRGGASLGDDIPQLEFRLGGPHTVRGYPYGTRRDREIWAAQVDLALARSPFWAPVVFVDVGDTFSADPLVGAGVGLSLLNGLIRFSLAKGLNPSTDVRFDLAFRAPR